MKYKLLKDLPGIKAGTIIDTKDSRLWQGTLISDLKNSKNKDKILIGYDKLEDKERFKEVIGINETDEELTYIKYYTLEEAKEKIRQLTVNIKLLEQGLECVTRQLCGK